MWEKAEMEVQDSGLIRFSTLNFHTDELGDRGRRLKSQQDPNKSSNYKTVQQMTKLQSQIVYFYSQRTQQENRRFDIKQVLFLTHTL